MTDAVIAKIQALLAKADSTQFEHEAEVFYAKAQELMTKHAVEQWQLRQAGNVKEKPIKYFFKYSTNDANLPGKTQLVMAAAKAAGVSFVMMPKTKKSQHGYLIGYEADCHFAELLYTSLLVQCMRFAPADVRRVKSRLTDFMLGFAQVVRGRVNDQQRQAEKADDGGSLLPALIDRQTEVEDAVNEFFPQLRTAKAVSRRTDWSSRRSGADAGARADISGGRNNVAASRKELG